MEGEASTLGDREKEQNLNLGLTIVLPNEAVLDT